MVVEQAPCVEGNPRRYIPDLPRCGGWACGGIL
jgi:hypothetical protein